MQLKKISLIFVIAAILLTLAALGGVWSQTSAQITIPTEPPPTTVPGEPGATPTLAPHSCVYGSLVPKADLDLFLPVKADTPRQVWGGVDTPGEAVCKAAVERLCKIPVAELPKREQLNYYRMAMEVLQFTGGKVNPDAACGNRKVYFELTGYERYMLDNYPELVGIYRYDSESRTWKLMSGATLDKTLGVHGHLVIETDLWGYFALGWPPK